jgi:hypothetical protein
MKLVSKPSMGCMLVIPTLRRLQQEDLEFKASLDYIAGSSLA